MSHNVFTLQQIGRVQAQEPRFFLEIAPEFRPALEKMDQFSHVIVVWWAHEHDTEADRKRVTTAIPYAGNMEAGVFACRAEYRPNPIGITVCQILSVNIETGIVELPYIDAYDGSPVLDLKPYFPVSDRVRDFTVPEWVRDWPDWYEDAYKLEELFARLFGNP
jgi:tRNA-Thr(GGU) m(6)t(6)A37 methyltransferase TsaA